MLCSGAAAEHPAADAPHAGGGEGEELGAAAAAADQAAAADGAAAAGPAPPHPQHAHTGNNEISRSFHIIRRSECENFLEVTLTSLVTRSEIMHNNTMVQHHNSQI